MTEHDALLMSVLSNPSDDTPRLVLADWLEDRDECDRAEFIRVQVELARCGGCHHDRSTPWCQVCGLRHRERELLETNGKAWMHDAGLVVRRQGFGTVAEALRRDRTFSRGFIASITCTWADWLRHSTALFWNEKQTVVCRKCDGTGRVEVSYAKGPCRDCWSVRLWTSTGRILKPFPATAQPLEEVRLTSIVGHLTEASNESVETWMRLNRYRFDRATCRTCDGQRKYGPNDWHRPCPTCRSVPLNEWYCDEWPGLSFRMPENQNLYIRFQGSVDGITWTDVPVPEGGA